MKWYNEYVEYGSGIRRPYLCSTGLEVHRVIGLLEDAPIPQAVVENYHALHDALSNIEEADDDDLGITVSSSEGFSVPELTIVHVEAAIDYARDHPEEIQQISEEQERLDEVMLLPPEEAHERLQNLDVDFFDVDSTLEYDDGEPVIYYDIE